MVKIFIGNLSQHAEKDEVEALFTQYGTVTECAKYKNYAFVHMEDRKSATKAIRELHLYKLNGRPINVELSRGNNQGPVKLHVANVEKGFDNELRELFEEYGTVTECAIIKNFAFVHMPNSDEAMDALKGLDNSEFQGKRIHVQISKSRPRGGPEDEFPPPPGRGGYYPPPPPHHYPGDRPEPPYGGRMGGYPPPPPPPPRRPMYPDRGYGDRDGYGVVDYYEKFRARPYPGYDDRRPNAIPPPPPPSAMVRERLGMGPADGFDRRPTLPPPPSGYPVRDRSPIRRPPVPPGPPGPPGAPAPPGTPAGNGYSYERSRLSPAPRTPMYQAPRPNFTERSAPVPPPQAPAPPRFPGY